MDDESDCEKEPRTPTTDDLGRIAQSLNDLGARYVVIGGFAIQHFGLRRPTEDIDLLIDPSPDNVEKIRQALCVLPDHASMEMEVGDVASYSVVRIADEVVVDLLASACGVTYDDVVGEIVLGETGGARVPYLHPTALIRTKMTIRPKDAVDRQFLEQLLRGEI